MKHITMEKTKQKNMKFTEKANIFHFISLNVRGMRDKMKRSEIFAWIRAQKTDIVFLQETYWTEDLQNQVTKEWNGRIYFFVMAQIMPEVSQF